MEVHNNKLEWLIHFSFHSAQTYLSSPPHYVISHNKKLDAVYSQSTYPAYLPSIYFPLSHV